MLENYFEQDDGNFDMWLALTLLGLISSKLRKELILPIDTIPWIIETMPKGNKNKGPRIVLNNVSETNAVCESKILLMGSGKKEKRKLMIKMSMKDKEFFLFVNKSLFWNKLYVPYSSEKWGLCLMKSSSEMLQYLKQLFVYVYLYKIW